MLKREDELSREFKIISFVGPYNRRSLTPAERQGRHYFFKTPLQGQEKSRYSWLTFILLFCPASTNNCVIICSNVSLAFCDGVCFVPGDNAGAPNEKNIEKRFKCSFLLSHIVLRSFKGTFARANTN